MKQFVFKNGRLIIICITIMVVAIAGFSYAYAANENTIYTRDELNEKINQIGKVYTNSVINTSSLVNGTTYNVCSLSLIDPGTYILYGYARASLTASVDFSCIFSGANFNYWTSRDNSSSDANHFCNITSYVMVNSSTNVYLNIYQSSGATKTLVNCNINAVKIR